MDLLSQTLDQAQEHAKKHRYHIHYAMKANTNDRILDLIHSKGFGADCVSGNEVKKALETGFKPNQIAFAGVGKSDEEIEIGLENDIFTFNCESVQEIEVINELAEKANKVARIALRLNPNVDAKTHKYITTGLEENKFGINSWELDDLIEKLATWKNIQLTGLHFHIGSQLLNLNPFANLCQQANKIIADLKTRGIELEHINVGGGLGIDYLNPDGQPIPNFEEYFKVFEKFLNVVEGQTVHFELGRAIVANCGVLLSKTLYVKPGITKDFIILDAGMTELMRPALYQAKHEIQNISKQDEHVEYKYDVVGPICESSDCFGKKIELKETKRGDYIKIYSTGAYGEVMTSGYNLREQNPVVYL